MTLVSSCLVLLQVEHLSGNLKGLEKERDFYFGKLRDIEVLCQEVEDSDTNPLVKSIIEILYATEVSCSNPTHLYFHMILTGPYETDFFLKGMEKVLCFMYNNN